MSNDIVVDDNELNEVVGVDETGAEGSPPQEELAATSVDTFSMPEKFQEKSAEEVAKSYVELEKELGRKNGEVGELRKLTDQYIHQELSRRTSEDDPNKENEPSIEFDDLVENPDKVLNAVVDKRLAEVNKRFDEQDSSRRAEKFMSDNPDYGTISETKEFYNWANASPYRVRQLQAAQSGDYEAAGDILQGYREQTGALQDAAKQGEKVKRDKALRDASTESSGTGDAPGKVWTKKELRDLLVNDPDRYYGSLADEINKAYSEGRVK